MFYWIETKYGNIFTPRYKYIEKVSKSHEEILNNSIYKKKNSRIKSSIQ